MPVFTKIHDCCCTSTLDEMANIYQIENSSRFIRSFVDNMEVDDYIAWHNVPIHVSEIYHRGPQKEQIALICL